MRWLAAVLLLALAWPAEARMHAGPNAMQGSHHRLRTPAGALDGPIVSASAAAGYSFRKLRSAYAGPAVKIRRTTGGTLDVGFTGAGDFDTSAATTFCNATTCFIDTWYDQSGNARNATQATTANQPALVFNCVGTKPCSVSTPTAQVLVGPSITPAGSESFSAVGKSASAADCTFLKAGLNYITSNAGNSWWLLWNNAAPVLAAAVVHGVFHAGAGGLDIGAAIADLLVDGTLDSGNQAVAPSLTAGTIQVSAGSGTGTVACSTGEAIWWTGYLLTATERASLVANQRAYWGF